MSAFASGYALSKLEPSFAVIFEDGRLVTTPLYGIRVLVLVNAAIAAAIGMYVFRLYTDVDEPGRRAVSDAPARAAGARDGDP